ncbi:glycoside hydrolase family 5 protein [Calocera viscosa TUFC12733]|uniref:Glycoside hydrolase family 5 protein n=1 Tax=Calocera viscosa (strain TUFC12733) TaxID=1330018 RepID=A0A167P111_CALVF|nr:glycoside hydrolase family 5 protein [Calocera viscosa TUFC12733]
MVVFALSVPSYSTRSKPSLHVVYQIVLQDTDSNRPITIYRRYGDIAALHGGLLKEVSATPLYSPPPKSTFKLGGGDAQLPLIHALKPCAWLDQVFLEQRRWALERYLRGLVQGRHAIWKNSNAWKEFISQPGDSQLSFPTFPKSALPIPTKNGQADHPQGTNGNTGQDSVTTTATNASPYIGANSYYLHTLPTANRNAVLSQLANSGFTVVRIFINQVQANNKGSGNTAYNDVEVGSVGNWDDTVLQAIDSMMVECKAVGLKLIIALHDRYSLGWDEVDVYATTYGIVPVGSTGDLGVTDATNFYNSNAAQIAMDARITHILNHVNTQLENKPWKELSDVIYAFEPENESQGYMDLVNPSWANDRAGTIKNLIGTNSGILVSNGGGVDIATSTDSTWAFGSNFDIVCVHDYSTDPWTTIPTVSDANGQVLDMGKTLLFEEWGVEGSSKASTIYAYVQACNDYNIPWCYWEVVIPGAGAASYEVWTTEPSWSDLTSG